MATKQEIVPVRLRDDKKKTYNQTQQARNQQKLIARIKNSDSELFIYKVDKVINGYFCNINKKTTGTNRF